MNEGPLIIKVTARVTNPKSSPVLTQDDKGANSFFNRFVEKVSPNKYQGISMKITLYAGNQVMENQTRTL